MQRAANVVLAALVYLAPLCFAADRLRMPEPWLGFTIMVVMLLWQPAISRREMVDRDSADRGSALAILVGMVAPQLAAVVELGYAPWRPHATNPALLAIGSLLAILGIALRVWSIRSLGAAFTPTVRVQDGQRVIDAGPYHWLRHPSYTGALAAAFGVTLALEAPIGCGLVVLVAVPAYLYRIRVEERALTGWFGATYRDYAARTKRLVPFVY